MRTLLPLLLTGCLVGTDHLKGIPNTPTLDGEVVLLTPEPGPDGAFAREGDTVEIGFSTLAAIDPEASIVTLDGFPMAFAGSDGFTYRYQRTLDGSEGSSPKTVTGTLRNAAERQGALGSPVLLETDFIPPTGSCVLNPRSANANDAITFVVTPSEPLREPPAITPSASELSVTFREQVEGQFFYDVVGETGVNLDGYTLTVEAFDRAGNPQRGDSLCEVEDRTGALLGRGPALDGEPSLTAAPSVEVGGVPWVRDGAVLTVSIPTAEPIDADASSVALSGLDLAPVADTPNTWTLTLDGTEGDGFKNLDAVLFDAAGNTLRVQRPAITRFDFTPPTADCVLSPREANGEQAVTFDVFASEPLDGGAPTVTPSDARITLTGPTTTGNQHRYAVSGPPGEDVVYTLDVQGTDLAGNPADGPLCPEEDASGAIRGRGPEVVGDIVVSLEPSVDIDGVPSARAGAELRVTIPTAQAVDPGRSIISLSGVPLVHDDTQSGTWARTLDGTEGDGLKRLDARLFDAAGNTRQEIRDDVVRFDFTAPSANCVLFPPVANAEDEVTLQVFASEELVAPPTATVDHLDVAVTLSPASTGNPHLFDLALTAPVDVSAYTVTLTATDLVGNAQTGASLCSEGSRTGGFLGVPPTLSGDITLTATPSLDEDGTPRAAGGALVNVTIPTAQPINPSRSFVSLSGFDLSSTDGTTWTGTLEPTLGDGLKTLTATLVDDAGNTLVVQDPTVAVFADFTPPQVASAILTRTPFFATADDGSGTVLFTTTDPLTGQAVSASLRVSTTEDLGEPALLGVHGPAPLTLASTGGSARLATWSLPTIPEGQDGTYTFDVTLEDALGNRSAPIPLEVVMEIDTVGPSVGPDVDTPDLITYVRQPWGSSSVSGGPGFRVQGAAGAASPGVLVVVENVGGVRLGSTTSSASGDFEVASGVDVGIVLVRSHDEAGNPGPPSMVRDVLWTATMGGKVPLSNMENPHRLGEFSLASPPPFRHSQSDFSERFHFPMGTSTERSWAPWEGDATSFAKPSARSHPALAYDAARGVVVMFGGFGSEAGGCGTPELNRCADTWEWNGRRWMLRTPNTVPPPRSGHELVYDSARGVTVLFGGTSSGGSCGSSGSLCSDTWEWNGSDWELREPTTSPPARSDHALAYDVERGVTVLFGGSGYIGMCGTPGWDQCSDTWEWDGVEWSEVAAAASGPAARLRHSLSYDTDRGLSVLFGGCPRSVGACDAFDDTWEWDGIEWIQRSPSISPPRRHSHRSLYDVARGVTQLMGGDCSEADEACSAIWEWDGLTWTERVPATSPPTRRSFGFAYDVARGVSLLFGGLHDRDRFQDTWEWDGADWRQRALDIRPLGRAGHAMSYDSERGRIVLFGGQRFPLFFFDTWEWSGSEWSVVESSASPTARDGQAMTFDERRGVTVLFGGVGVNWGSCSAGGGLACGDTWEWNGSEWNLRTPTTSPPARGGHALVYDSSRNVSVLFGGEADDFGDCGTPDELQCSDTWEWDGEEWILRDAKPSPPPRSGHAMSYDRLRGVTVMFGGESPFVGSCGVSGSRDCSDTWEWDGSSWVERTSESVPPPGQVGQGMVYDESLGITLLYRGDETWEWDGFGWSQRSPAVSPSGRSFHGLAYDSASREAMLFGGNGSSCDAATNWCSDTWFLPSDSPLSPRHTFTAAFAPALARDATLRTVTARWVAGGSGTPGGDPTEGAELLVWNGLGWTVLDAHAAGPDAPAPLCTRLVADETAPPDPGCNDLIDPGLVNRLFRFGPDLTSTFAVRPTAPIGTDEGELRSEDVAVTVRYRLPPE